MNAIVVVYIGKNQIFEISKKSIEKYCKKYGIAFEVITETKFDIKGDDFTWLAFEKLQIYDLYEKYDRILCLDADVIISPNCPNIFEIVPQDKVGVVFTDSKERKNFRAYEIENIKKDYGDIEWEYGYFNIGVFLTSKVHRDLFRLSMEDIDKMKRSKTSCKEQSLINYRVRKENIPIYELDYRFNHVLMFSESWNGSPNRRKSFIIHYAGRQDTKPDLMMLDYQFLWESRNRYTLMLKELIYKLYTEFYNRILLKFKKTPLIINRLKKYLKRVILKIY